MFNKFSQHKTKSGMFSQKHTLFAGKSTHTEASPQKQKMRICHLPSFKTLTSLYTSSPQTQSIVSGVLDKAVHCTDYFSITCETLQMQILSLLFFL